MSGLTEFFHGGDEAVMFEGERREAAQVAGLADRFAGQSRNSFKISAAGGQPAAGRRASDSHRSEMPVNC